MLYYKMVEDGIARRDINTLREALGSICYVDGNFSTGEFEEVVKYIESKGIKLKDDALLGETTISSQKDDFTREDFGKAVYALKKNFCDERIADVKKIGRTLYPIPKENKAKIKEENPKNFQSHQSKVMVLSLVALIVVIVVLILAVR